MRRRSRNHEARNTFLKYIAYFGIVFAIFYKELWYFLQLFWHFISSLKMPLPEILASAPVDPDLIFRYLLNLFWGIVLYFVALQFFSFFNAQFLLPVYSWQERVRVFQTFRDFMRGLHGPLIFVRDGEVISHIGESSKKGPGVVLINSNSAVVVGNQAHGPGIVFTGGRRIGMVMDLRKQVRTAKNVRAVTRDGIEVNTDISVQFSISAPPEIIYVTFAGKGVRKEDVRILDLDDRGDVIVNLDEGDFFPDEKNEIFRTVQRMQMGDHEDLPFIDLEQYEGSLYIPERVQMSFTNQPRRPIDGERIDWRDLPLNIAIEEFRNTIVGYPFDDLFIPAQATAVNEPLTPSPTYKDLTGSTRISGLEQFETQNLHPMGIIRRVYGSRVRNSGFLAYIFVERKDKRRVEVGNRISDLEMTVYPPILLQYPRPLRRSVVSVSSVEFGEIVPTNEEVRRQTIQNLVARWNSEAFRTEVGYEEQAALIRSRAKAQVQQDTVYALRDILQSSDKTKTALILRIFQALEAATAGSDNKEMVSMVKMLGDLGDWFKFSDSGDSALPGGPYDIDL
ncbi:hypothetical protein KQH61_04170 [bacterium]|nr:hypothetical protein [bacterium]MCB2179099.1 hypothetical protein [bacterium]